MKAAIYRSTGPAAEVFSIVDRDDLVPGPGEVRVRVHASGINPADVKLRSGKAKRSVSFHTVIPHNDGAGLIDKVGPDLPASREGERVWVYNAQYFRPFGTAAEYVIVPADWAVRLPGNIGFEAAACFGIPLQTAYRAVTIEGQVDGLTILVAGGAGAVAHYAIQIAKLKGATVIATVSSDEKARHALDAGADHVVNYRTEDVVERVLALTDGAGVDRLIEVNLCRNGHLIAPLLKPFGTIVVYGSDDADATIPALPSIAKSLSYRFFVVYEIRPEVRRSMIDDLTGMLERNEIRHAIAATYPLERIADAHAALESGSVIGNVVVRID